MQNVARELKAAKTIMTLLLDICNSKLFCWRNNSGDYAPDRKEKLTLERHAIVNQMPGFFTDAPQKNTPKRAAKRLKFQRNYTRQTI